MNALNLTKRFAAGRHEVFESFTDSKILESWAAPDNMTLKIPQFEAKVGGRYRWEHTSDKGVYICTGYFKEFVPDERLVQNDTVIDPTGEIIFSNLKCETEFRTVGNETEVHITQGNFEDEKAAQECERSWNECFQKLDQVISRKGRDEGDEYLSSYSL